MTHRDLVFYAGSLIGLFELIAIGTVVYALAIVFTAADDENRAHGSKVGIVGAGALIVLIQLGKPLFH